MNVRKSNIAKKIKMLLFTGLLSVFMVIPPVLSPQTDAETAALSPSQQEQIEKFVQGQMTTGKIPGMAIAIVKGDRTIYEKGFGFADIEKKTAVTPETLFELGSCSKAFTGLAILQLAEKGSLKLDDPVGKYIPWLKLQFKGKEVPVTIGQFLYQTSGIPFESIGAVPETAGEDALEKTVRTLVGTELMYLPGQKFFYATINYDVLGLVIQQVAGLPYETYMKKNILEPLQMKGTYLSHEEAQAHGLAEGYKLCFGKPTDYDAPIYRGNLPAGYIIANATDLARWLKIQMGTIDAGTISKELIEKSHVPDPNLTNSNYAAGWVVLKNYGFITHSGTNPNFSSFLGFGAEKIGIAVLANTSSGFTTAVGHGILAIMRGGQPRYSLPDQHMRVDGTASVIVLVFVALIAAALVMLIIAIVKIFGGKRKFYFRGKKRVVGFIVATVMLALLVYILSILPSLAGYNLPLSFGFVWFPLSFTYAVLAIFLAGFLYYLFFLSVLFFPKKHKIQK